MKILSLLVVLLAFCRETRHQFPIFYPPFSLSLANEEFIEPSPPVVQEESNVISNNHQNTLNNDHPSPIIPPPSSVVENPAIQDATKVYVDQTNNDFPNISPPFKTTQSLQSEQKPVADDGKPSAPNEIDSADSAVSSQNQNVIQGEVEGGEGNKTNDDTHGSQTEKHSPPPGPVVLDTQKRGDEDEPIPSYMEWAQKKQMELKSNSAGQNGHSGVAGGGGQGSHHQAQNGHGQNGGKNGSVTSATGVDAKNFASPDCGAKVVQSNAESQNPSGVLSSSHDEYMLNKCGTTIWFVVELCEPLTIERISIGNLELFSSSPKEVEFGISDRYPTRDWVKLGPFTLPDARAIHPVVLPATNASTFGKFVKFSVHSHHGSEHYCPISVIRVNGKSEYEVLESETTHQEDESKEGGALYEEPIEEVATQNTGEASGGKVGGLKDAVLNMLNKAVQSIVRRGFSSSNSEANGETDQLSLLKSQCRSILQCVPHSHLTHDIYRLLSCNSSILLPFLAANSPWCGWDYCHATFETRSIGLPWQPEGFYASLFGGPSVLIALCHYLKPMTDGCDPTCLAMNNNTFHQDNVSEYINESFVAENNTIGGFTVQVEHQPQIPPTTSSGHETLEEPSGLPKPTTDTVQDTTQPPVVQQLDAPPVQASGYIPSTLPTGSGANLNSGSPPQQPHLQQQQQQQQQETQIQPPAPVSPEDIASMQQGQPQQKESVFVRLTNRIKNLERNQSLTASYLEELSKRFKKQNEDNAILAESNRKTMNETRVKMFQLDEFYRQESQSLRRNLDDVRERLFNVQLQRSLLVIICLSQTMLIIGAIVWGKKKFANLQQQTIDQMMTPSVSSRRQTLTDVLLYHEKRRESDPLLSTASCMQPLHSRNVDSMDSSAEATRVLVMRKRSNSDTVPSEKAKRRKEKRIKKQLANAKTGLQVTDSKLPLPPITSSVPLQTTGIKTLDKINPEFTFKMPKSRSGDNGFFDVPKTTTTITKPKENVDPQFSESIVTSNLNLPKSRSLTNSNSNSPTLQLRPQTLQQAKTTLSTSLARKDDDFTLQPKISSSAFVQDPIISTSTRFALLASPTRESHSPSPSFSSSRERYFPTLSGNTVSVPPSISTPYHRSGSTESSASTGSTQSGSLSQTSSGGLTGIFNNGHRPASISSNDSSAIPASALLEGQVKKGRKGGLKAFMPKFFDR